MGRCINNALIQKSRRWDMRNAPKVYKSGCWQYADDALVSPIEGNVASENCFGSMVPGARRFLVQQQHLTPSRRDRAVVYLRANGKGEDGCWEPCIVRHAIEPNEGKMPDAKYFIVEAANSKGKPRSGNKYFRTVQRRFIAVDIRLIRLYTVEKDEKKKSKKSKKSKSAKKDKKAAKKGDKDKKRKHRKNKL
jgi:hypothetical protein